MNNSAAYFVEQRAIWGLSSILGLRMIGLFMVLPVFAVYLQQFAGHSSLLVGMAIGIYGLTQAFLQIPLGILSDYIGRKPVIALGLFIFVCGSLIVGLSHSITTIIWGRALQGAGAVGSSILALLADLTFESRRTRAMAFIGIVVGVSFFVAMMLGPLLVRWMAVNQLFMLAALLGLSAIVLLFTVVPFTSDSLTLHRDNKTFSLSAFLAILMDPLLYKLSIGVCILHMVLTANFIDTPLQAAIFREYSCLLPVLLGLAFMTSLMIIMIAEKRKQIKYYLLISILILVLAESLLWQRQTYFYGPALGIYLFFAGFSTLEAFLPSLVSRMAPMGRKGSALGLYSSAQFFGIFIGGLVGGWIDVHYASAGLYLFCILSICSWLGLAAFMKIPL